MYTMSNSNTTDHDPKEAVRVSTMRNSNNMNDSNVYFYYGMTRPFRNIGGVILFLLVVVVATVTGITCGTGHCGGSRKSPSSATEVASSSSKMHRSNDTTTVVVPTTVPVVQTTNAPTLRSPPTSLAPSNGPVHIIPSVFPSLSPTVPLEPIDVACQFLSMRNITECVRTTSIGWRINDTLDRISADVVVVGSTTIPSELGLLTQLTYLDLYYDTTVTYTSPQYSSKLNGTIPSTLGLLTRLQYLGLYLHALTGTIPSTLGALTQLTHLDMDQNQLTGTIPSTFENLTNLNSLFLSSNHLMGTVPPTICTFSEKIIQVDCANISCSCCFNSRYENCPLECD